MPDHFDYMRIPFLIFLLSTKKINCVLEFKFAISNIVIINERDKCKMLKYFVATILSFFLTACDIAPTGLVAIDFEASSLTISPTIDVEAETDPLITGGDDNKVYKNSNYPAGSDVEVGTYTFTATIQFDTSYDCETEDTTVTYELEVVSDEEYSISVFPTGCDLSVSGF